MKTEKDLVKTLTDFLVINSPGSVPCTQADAVILFGSSRFEPINLAAGLMQKRIAPVLVCSGSRGRLTARWPTTEAEVFANIVRRLGFKGAVLTEKESTNTGDNLKKSCDLLQANNYCLKRIIAITVAPVQRRIQAVAEKYLPEVVVIALSPRIAAGEEWLTSLCLGEVQRLATYPKLGFQADVQIPKSVLIDAKELMNLGYEAR